MKNFENGSTKCFEKTLFHDSNCLHDHRPHKINISRQDLRDTE